MQDSHLIACEKFFEYSIDSKRHMINIQNEIKILPFSFFKFDKAGVVSLPDIVQHIMNFETGIMFSNSVILCK